MMDDDGLVSLAITHFFDLIRVERWDKVTESDTRGAKSSRKSSRWVIQDQQPPAHRLL